MTVPIIKGGTTGWGLGLTGRASGLAEAIKQDVLNLIGGGVTTTIVANGTDDTESFERAFAAVPTSGGVIRIPPGRYYLTGLDFSLSGPTTVINEGVIVNSLGSLQPDIFINVDCGSYTLNWLGWGGEIDGNDCYKTILQIKNGSNHYLALGRVHGITGKLASDSGTSGLYVYNTTKVTIETPNVYDCVLGAAGAFNSYPRAITLDATTVDTTVNNPIIRNCNDGMVSFGTALINNPDVRDCTDNGFYLQGFQRINGGVVTNCEEPLVCVGGTVIYDGMDIYGNTNAATFSNCDEVIYKNCRFDATGGGIGTRTGNVGHTVGRVTLLNNYFYGSPTFAFVELSSGTVSELVMKGNVIRAQWNTGKLSSLKLINWSSGTSYHCTDNDFILEDISAGGTMPASNYFLTLANVNIASAWSRNRLINRVTTGAAMRVSWAEPYELTRRMSAQPGNDVEDAIRTLIFTLKAEGLWAKLDVLYVLVSHDDVAARLNWINTSYTFTESGTITFKPNAYYKGDGSTGYIDSGFGALSGVPKWQQDSACFGVVVANNIQEDVFCCGGTNTTLTPRNTSDQIGSRLNSSGSDLTAGVTDAKGHWVLDRSGAAGYDRYRNGVLHSSVVRASEALNGREFWIGAQNAAVPTYSVRQFSAMHAGSHLTANEIARLYALIRIYIRTMNTGIL